MNVFELARARRMARVQKDLCPHCMTMLAFAEQTHRCRHGKPCVVFEYECEFEWICGACRDAFSERERLHKGFPVSALETVHAPSERLGSNVSGRPTAWGQMVAWIAPRRRQERWLPK